MNVLALILLISKFYMNVYGLFECSFNLDGFWFNLKALDYIYYVTNIYTLDTEKINMTWSISLCKGMNSEVFGGEGNCKKESRICGVKRVISGEKERIEEVKGLYFDIDDKYLTDNGFEVMFHNNRARKSNLSAIINFICDEKEHDPKLIAYKYSMVWLEWKTKSACKDINYVKKKNGTYGFFEFDLFSYIEMIKNMKYFIKDFALRVIVYIRNMGGPYREGYTAI
ncbi:hypothetical protein T552_00529 [Pneumocystis carinii B80]|uniref:Autophagy-related protein 27 n=1 Tax=Pneumocystis carinii (strain B80) TaxID=1408658 RepID=A0A0W4ZR23_PNEC8|nr:hypothetical protein T552_00529 [Pneumocystis carinii B80]KTW30817.1 hypothetical protein T552_00529 [Pneumocystis carinii B80]